MLFIAFFQFQFIKYILDDLSDRICWRICEAWKFGTVCWYTPTHSSDCALCLLFHCKLFIYLFTYLFIYVFTCVSSLHYPEPLQFVPHLVHIMYLFDFLILSFFLYPFFPKWSVSRFLMWPLHLVCFAHRTLPDLRSWRFWKKSIKYETPYCVGLISLYNSPWRHRGSGGIALPILNLGAGLGSVVNFTP
jgi:hypothetical protein